MFTTPKAILIGFCLIALAITFQPIVGQLIISKADAQLDMSEYNMIRTGFSNISTAISGIRACRD